MEFYFLLLFRHADEMQVVRSCLVACAVVFLGVICTDTLFRTYKTFIAVVISCDNTCDKTILDYNSDIWLFRKSAFIFRFSFAPACISESYLARDAEAICLLFDSLADKLFLKALRINYFAVLFFIVNNFKHKNVPR